MFTELIMEDISSLGVMSNSDLFIVKEEQKQIEFQVSSRSKSEFPELDDHDHHQEEEQDQHRGDQDDDDEEEEEDEEEDKCDDQATAEDQVIKSAPYLGESDHKKIADNYDDEDDDDGFRTPTSLDHKIPVITQCPPAPRKRRPQSSTTKRKRLSPSSRRSLSLDLSSDEVESMFPEDFGRCIKSARMDYHTK